MSYDNNILYNDEEDGELEQVDAFEARELEKEKEQGLDRAVYCDGDEVKEAGEYVCSPCGYKISLNAGDIFPSCTECIKLGKDEVLHENADSEEDFKETDETNSNDSVVTEKGIWEKVVDINSEE